MVKQVINVGSAPNDGTGDTARDSFTKCNSNFDELYTGLTTVEGTAILSTGEAGGTKFLREDGDGTCSWQDVVAGVVEGTSILSTGPVTDGWVLTADGAGGAAWEAAAGGGASQLSDLSDVNTSTPTNRNVLVADGVDWESRALTEADISDLGTYLTTVQLSDLTDVNTSTPTNRNVLIADGVDWESRALTEADISDLGNYAVITPQFKSAAYTAVAGDRIYVDCSGGAVTITLPASPTTGDEVMVLDSSGDAATNNVTVARNGETIDGAAADFVIDLNYGSCAFAYSGTDWKINPTNGVQ